MYIIKTKFQLQKYLHNKQIGFVPTMGALHKGHLELIKKSKEENPFTVCSIFVNPTQFNNQNDFIKYPKTIERDIELLQSLGCDLLFLPNVEEMYPEGASLHTQYPLENLENIFEGKFRPGHFQGVCMIVERLLLYVNPQKIYLGEKDYQQCLVIKKLINYIGSSVEIRVCPTLRENSGLAMSSRNLRLSEDGKIKAASIYQCLNDIKNNFNKLSFEEIKKECITKLSENNIETEYLSLANADDLSTMNEFNIQSHQVVLFAGYLEGVRLIDNMKIN